MSFADVRRTTVSAALLTRLAGERGLAREHCLRGTGINAEQLADPQAIIDGDQELQLIRNVLGALGPTPGLGLDAGLRYQLSSYGLWGYALLSSRSFRDATHLAVRYLDLSHAFGRFRAEARGRDLLIVLDDSGLPEDLRQFLIERDFAAWANAARELRPGGFPARHAQFRFARPEYASRFDRLCGVRPSFGAARNELLLDAATLDTPLPMANPAMARLCEEQCRQLLAKRRVRGGIAGEVRDLLLRTPATMPSMEAVAEQLHMASRSLRRRLIDEDSSFRALVDEVRQAIAEELLTSGRMKLNEVAARLGYAEPAPFITAFRRWRGMSPTQYRQMRRDDAAILMPTMSRRPY
ncbi:MAG: AraC family transcriptional regulator [Hydrocarboniphaga sp.]|uniref:AraC family transcriptional regulator n=1 Tax=Hydrocarboniphaga sp. TaxID=2033016 RepID=UPI002614D6B7|nr:AraC family transcriptional regulator [Hydrocarboniphaga sp.]MDB5970323.1 AraC family transcriptional regulator [Hydrocarboniphaga sp.]